MTEELTNAISNLKKSIQQVKLVETEKIKISNSKIDSIEEIIKLLKIKQNKKSVTNVPSLRVPKVNIPILRTVTLAITCYTTRSKTRTARAAQAITEPPPDFEYPLLSQDKLNVTIEDY